MYPIRLLRRQWQRWTGEDETPLDGDTPAWALSFFLHFGALLALALFWNAAPRDAVVLSLEFSTPQPLEQAPAEFEYSPAPQTEIGSNSEMGVDSAMAQGIQVAELVDIQNQAPPDAVPTVAVSEYSWDPAEAPTLAETVPVKGAAGEGATGASGAIDQITEEIHNAIDAEGPTLVVWLFDQSNSMHAQRQQVAARFSRIYEELGLIGDTGQGALLTAVVAFGEKITFRTDKPTEDLALLKQTVEGIENDQTGLENVFSAVYQAVDRYKTFRTKASTKRYIMLVVVTDEAGDDDANLERAIGLCQRYGTPVFCVGASAPFGRRDIELKYVDPDTNFDQTVQFLPAHQGPESLAPENLQLAFSGVSNDPNSDYMRLDSGFGPYGLTRLCVETSGRFFAVHPNRETTDRRVGRGETAVMSAALSRFFNPSVMRDYRPDYVSIREYQELLKQNKARQALVAAATQSQIDPMQNPQTEFPKADEASFKRMLDQAQRGAALVEFKLGPLYATLVEGEKDRPKLTQPRWQAGFDLAMGRVLAVKVRTEAYNAMLAKAKGGLKFNNPDNDTFVIVPANEITVGSALEKMAKQAHEYLERVVRDHPDTPWALLAQRELKEPIGWKWSEKRVNLPPPPPAAAGNGNAAPPTPQPNVVPKKPVRQNVKL